MKRYKLIRPCLAVGDEEAKLQESSSGEWVKYEPWMDNKEALYQKLIELEQQGLDQAIINEKKRLDRKIFVQGLNLGDKMDWGKPRSEGISADNFFEDKLPGAPN